ncbi:hypothetical protein ACSBR1_004942 [Camellia fascicularis]
MKTFILLVFPVTLCLEAKAQVCRPSGNIRGRKPPPGQCNIENDSDCCADGKLYPVYKCSPAVSSQTKAVLTLNSFEDGGDGGGPSECDNKYHSDDKPVVALSTGWYNGGSRCLNYITAEVICGDTGIRAKQIRDKSPRTGEGLILDKDKAQEEFISI